MDDRQYRRRLQRLADFLVGAIPDAWHQAGVRVEFEDEVTTSLEVWWRESPSANDQWADVGLAVLSGFVGAAKEVRKELVGAGNPECKAFVFRLTKDGKSSLDVEY